MELQGRIEFISKLEKGQDKNGKDFEKAYFVISDEVGQYPNRYKLELYNKTDLMRGIKTGDRVKVQANGKVNEHNGNHYGSLSPYKIDLDATTPAQAPATKTEKVDVPF